MSDVSVALGASIKSASQFDDTPAGWAQRWAVEMSAAKEFLKKFHEDGRKVVSIFRAEESETKTKGRLGLYTSNVQTLQALLFGKVPHVDVKRRWGDQQDRVARCAGEMMQRHLNTDIARDGDTYTTSLEYVLGDRIRPGFGLARVRYVADFRTKKVEAKYRMAAGEDGQEAPELDEEGNQIELAPAYDEEEKIHEDVVVDYLHWDDVLWSAGARIFEEIRWVAFRCPMSLDELHKRFDDKLGRPAEGDKPGTSGKARVEMIPLNSKDNRRKDGNGEPLAGKDPWDRADVWEVWDKENRKVWWWVEGFDEILDDVPDPYELEGFWPFPRPLAANLTTDAYVPKSDYMLAREIYEEINVLSGRIAMLEEAVRVAGLYNGNSEEVKRLLTESGLNELIGVSDWRQFADSGGIEGNIAWFPLEQVAKGIQLLEQQRSNKIALLYQVTGMSDIMRGESSQPATATEQAIKAKFASVRVQEFQEQFARFASDLQRLRMELICKMFDDQTIIDRSNIKFTADAELAQAAVQLLRDEFVAYRIEVKPESISATDYAAMQQERTQAMTMVSQFLTALGPLGQQAPELVPDLLDMMRWVFTGFRGGDTIEMSIDKLVQKATASAAQAVQARMNPPPDPKAQTEKLKQQTIQQKGKLDMAKTQAQTQAHVVKAKVDTQKAVMQHEIDIEKMRMQIQRDGMAAATEVAGTASDNHGDDR